MLQKQTINGFKWVDGVNVAEEEVKKILKRYDIHELDLKACLEWNQRTRVDKYSSYSFIVLHFPKYNTRTKLYDSKEIYIFLSEAFLFIFRDFNFAKIHHLYSEYSHTKDNNETELKVTSVYATYEIFHLMLEKAFNSLKSVRIDMKEIEKKVFEWVWAGLVRDIMLQKKNIVLLSHSFKPWIMVLKQLQYISSQVYGNQIRAYFEELEDKTDQLVSEIAILKERIESIEDAFKSMLDIKTNFTIKILTIFSAFLLPLTLITSFYGMNIDLPYANSPVYIFNFLWLSLVFMLCIYLFLKRNWKI